MSQPPRGIDVEALGEQVPLLEGIRTTRAIRRLLPDPVPREVPVHLFIAGWTRRSQPQIQALFPCVQNVLLACRAVGLGASLTTAHRAFGPELDAWLGLPENCPTCALIPIGWPRGRYGRPPRRSVDESLSWERYSDAAENNA